MLKKKIYKLYFLFLVFISIFVANFLGRTFCYRSLIFFFIYLILGF